VDKLYSKIALYSIPLVCVVALLIGMAILFLLTRTDLEGISNQEELKQIHESLRQLMILWISLLVIFIGIVGTVHEKYEQTKEKYGQAKRNDQVRHEERVRIRERQRITGENSFIC
jgi:NADH:ubiquinone oxidoreductase subunit 5 (subunit L)/multisubunit Na+/H+ antiporter MnhA subunit